MLMIECIHFHKMTHMCISIQRVTKFPVILVPLRIQVQIQYGGGDSHMV